MGVSRFAFRMKISDQTTFADSIYIFDWRQTLQTVMEELGYTITMLCGQLQIHLYRFLEQWNGFRSSSRLKNRSFHSFGSTLILVSRCCTSIHWLKPYVHEWSVIYGYNDEQRIVYLTDPMHPEGKTLSFDDVTDNPVRFAAASMAFCHKMKGGQSVSPSSGSKLNGPSVCGQLRKAWL